MQTDLKTVLLLSVCTIILAGRPSNFLMAAEPAAKPERPKLYDTSADANRQLAAALKTAKAENKRLILKFGANW